MKLSYGKIADYVIQMEKINTQMIKCYDLIKSDVSSVSNFWTGDAASYFVNSANKLSSNFEEFSSELRACALYLQKCSDEYKNVDNIVKSEIEGKLSNSKFFS